MKNILLTIFLILPLFTLNHCGGKKVESHDKLTKDAPEWVVKGDGAFPSEKGTTLRGVGVMTKNPNIALQRQGADSRARKAIAETLNTYVGSLLKDFMQSHTDYTAPEQSTSVEFVSSISKSVTDTTLVGAKIIDRWVDKDGNMYALAELSFDGVASTLQQQVSDAIKLKKAAFLEEKSNEAMEALNVELEKRKMTP